MIVKGEISVTTKPFEKPEVETVHFNQSIMTASSCGCDNELICPGNQTNCTGDGAVCTDPVGTGANCE